MCFSLDLINFSGADSLDLIYSSVLAGIPQSLQSRQNALVGIHETSSWGDGNLADKGSGSYYCHSSRESGLSKKSNMFSRRIPLSFL